MSEPAENRPNPLPGSAQQTTSGPADRTSAPAHQATLGQILIRGLLLRCPVCGKGPMFRGWLTMNQRCSHCGLYFEPESGMFLGSIYVNYAVTTVIAAAVYLIPMFIYGRSPKWLLIPITLFCLLFPLYFFRYARCFWLGFLHFLSPMNPEDRPWHES